MEGERVENWHDYLVAQAGAAAALSGLVFVGLSINLDRIIKLPSIVSRAAAAILLLLNVLLISSLLLVPHESLRFLSLQVLIVGGLVWAVVTWLSVASLRGLEDKYRHNVITMAALRQVAMIPLLIGGLLLFTTSLNGMYWLVWAFTLTFIVTMAEAWVILVEIDR